MVVIGEVAEAELISFSHPSRLSINICVSFKILFIGVDRDPYRVIDMALGLL